MPVAVAVEQTVMQEVLEVQELAEQEEVSHQTVQMLQMQILAAAAAGPVLPEQDLHLETVALAL